MNDEAGDRPNASKLSIIPSRAIFDKCLSPANLRVLGALCSYTDREGICFPSQGTLAGRLGMSRRTVSRSINKLESLGYVAVNKRTRENGSTTTNLYKVIYAYEEEEVEQADAFEAETEQPKKSIKKAKRPKQPEMSFEEELQSMDDNAHKAGTGARKVQPVKQEIPGPWQMGRALAGICRMNFEINKGQLVSEGKRISAIKGFSLEKMGALFGKPGGMWYIHDWRGKKGQYPTPAQVRQTWAALEEKLNEDPGRNPVGGEEGWLYV